MANLVISCDGTWNTADQQEGGVPTPTNVVRLHNLVAERDKDGVEQEKYYHPGVGTDGGLVSKALGGGIGLGLDRNIKSGYRWLCDKYAAQDRIFLFGFSRGAYTARSLGGMVTRFGLIDPTGLSEKQIWERIDDLFQNGYRVKGAKRKAFIDKKWGFKKGEGPDGFDIPIHFIGVWDTVGALGIPDHLGVLNLIDDPRKYEFHDTNLNPLVRCGRHALAIDEVRASFEPTLWTNTDGRDVKQIWFPGAHSDVGGGYREIGLANGSLTWMLNEAKAKSLAVDPDIEAQIKADCRDLLHNSLSDVFKLLPSKPRAIPALDTGDERFLHTSVTDRCKIPPVTQMPYRKTKRLKKGESETFAIYASEPWNSTGLFLEKGETYKLEATGEWLDSDVPCGPDGTDDGKFQAGEVGQLIGSVFGKAETLFKSATGSNVADFWLTKRHEKLPWFTLVGVIANGKTDEDGTVTHEVMNIGKGVSSVPVAAAGYLYAYANDAWNFYSNNRGSVQLKVTRVA